MQEDSEKLIDKTYVIVTRLEQKAKMFGNGMLALSRYWTVYSGFLLYFALHLL